MSAPEIENEIRSAVRERARETVAHAAYVRSVKDLLSRGVSQSELARRLGISQPAVWKMAARAGDLSVVPEGFTGADAYEIIQQYAAGDLSEDELKDQLVRWKFTPGEFTDGYDWTTGELSSFSKEVGRAYDERLIDAELYDWLVDHAIG